MSLVYVLLLKKIYTNNTSVFQDSETPLIKATKMRNIEIVELLLDKGAKVSAVDKVSTSNTLSCTVSNINKDAFCPVIYS